MSQAYRDRITIWQDTRATGDELPTYGTARATGVACDIKPISGDETWRGRQLTEKVDYVVQFWHTTALQATEVTDQVEVTSGIFSGKRLNPRFSRVYPYDHGKPPMMELFCRESQ